eukprot:gene18117-24551_t
MGATVLFHPSSYINMVPKLRKILNGGSSGGGGADDPMKGNDDRKDRNKCNSGADDAGLKDSVNQLFEIIDFVGISAYAPTPEVFEANQLQTAAFQRRGMELQFSEFGIAIFSYVAADGSTSAVNRAQVAMYPYLGVWGPYMRNTDPWAVPDNYAFRNDFYRKTLKWLETGGGPTYPVTACFLWSVASWDFLAIHPEATIPGEGSYLDDELMQLVRAHNIEQTRP